MNETEKPEGEDMKQYYVLGLVVLVAVVVAGYMLRNKSTAPTTSPTTQEAVAAPTPTPGPITKLACDTQYFNPKIGFSEYYLSVEGGDVSKAASVDCSFSVTSANKEIATAKATSPMTDKPERGGSTFRCTTKAVAIKPGVPTVVDISLKDDMGTTATCSAPFVFPAP